jgi:hypothetical protein
MKPGTFSLMTPPPAEVGGPQQGGFSSAESMPAALVETFRLSDPGSSFINSLIFTQSPHTSACSIQLFLKG